MTENARTPRWLIAVVSTRPTQRSVDAALVVVRVALAWVFLYYGAGKLFGWWHGPGLDVSADFFANTAHLRPGRFFAVLGGLMEFGGAIAVALGLGVRLVGVALCADMVLAMALVTWTNGIDTAKVPPGYELNLALAALALVLALLGAGRFSVDALAERRLRTREG
jgi:putative oxidoreductase